MLDRTALNPTTRFTGLSDLYARYRPTYPLAVLDLIQERCRLGPDSLLVDVGCGTGISARLFAERGIPVLGVEPNAEMRAKAAAEPLPPGTPTPVYRDGRAEATGLADAIADAILAAQAFHWFEPEASLREFHRILKPDGWVALLWNERDDRDPFTAAYSAVIRTAPDAERLEMNRGRAGEPLLHSPWFCHAERLTFGHEQALDQDGVLGRAFSASYAPREGQAAEVFAAGLREVFARFQRDGEVQLRYETSLYVAQRRSCR